MPTAPMNVRWFATLRSMRLGARLVGARIFPFPHRYTLRFLDGATTDLPFGVVHGLTDAHLIEVVNKRAQAGPRLPRDFDEVEFWLTDLGQRTCDLEEQRRADARRGAR